ncbi:RING-H2 finger protein ATL79 [Acorus gramineus]|uniref:RING-H2 finger protein ATL79 n=1 Tax=Acorus gramineus TaxID=55184 RepID=A0AAV8ZXZ5_ACOGR|nr:RING-H2 finger protein ATL79 [Acorus gramineus]KAK1258088.1 RING-H2 finger protein ATL79 [Acorus gramineus]KAK1258325.1 RING-H2 finger protein ATL79 [Acorus gramineus]
MPSPNTTSVSPPPTTPKTGWGPYRTAKDFDANLAMILILLISALVCALALNAAIRFFLRLLRRHRTDNFSDDPEKHARMKPTATAAASQPTLVYSAAGKSGLSECAICLSEFAEGEHVRVLPSCRHGFHVKCIEGWLSARSSCPTCRAAVVVAGGGAEASERAAEAV